MKRSCLSLKVAGFLLLNILLCADIASGQLTVNPSSANFGTVQVGTNSTQGLALGNSGKSDLTVSQGAVTGKGFTLSSPALPLTLHAGQNAIFSVIFAPGSSGSVSGSLSLVTSTLAIHDRSGKHNSTSNTTTTVSLTGTGATPTASAATPTTATPGALLANPAALGFTGVQVGSSQAQSAALSNSGGSTVTISKATATGSGFTLSGLTLPLTLPAGQSVTFSVIFAPLSAGSTSGSISVSSDASTPTTAISLSGTGMPQGQLAVNPGSTDFGSVTVGTSKTQSGTLSASGSSITLSSASVTDSEFSLSGITLPLTLAAGQSVPFTLTFAPRASGTAAAALSFTSNAANSPAETLTGTGVAAPQHQVDLSWNASAAVAGYNVYRGNQTGGPYTKLNPVLDASTSYTDSSVLGGQNYYYVTTSVNSSGTQSAYSNEIQAVIPGP